MPDAQELPERIGKYEILGIAGRGGMGIVYHAHDPFFDREVAIKTIGDLALAQQDQAIARKMLFNEARAARNLDHGAIVQVFDAGEHDGEPYVVMEFVPRATTLREHCRFDSLLPVERVIEIAYVCARALDYAHRQGVIHRDIKASNIMLTGDGRVKIGDFGIARLDTVEATEILGTLGSPRYMSPEQLMEKSLTPATDIYSLGVVLYELLSGHPAFEGKTIGELSRRIITEMPTPVRELRADVPEALCAVVDRALHKQPDQRYPDGLAMAADLAVLASHLERAPDEFPAATQFRLARPLAFFSDFSDSELTLVVDACSWQRFASGERIIREGNMEHAFYVLVSGEVSVSKGGTRVGTLGKGSVFGEMGFIARATRSASVHARDDTVVLSANAGVLAVLPTAIQLRFTQAFLHTLVDRLTSTTERLSKYLT